MGRLRTRQRHNVSGLWESFMVEQDPKIDPKVEQDAKIDPKVEQHAKIDPKVEQRLKALNSFKDWSNYLLVTTVAALGWVASSRYPGGTGGACVVGCLAGSIICGIFTLALVPIVSEGVSSDKSIYETDAQFYLFYFGSKYFFAPKFVLKWVCWPQHVLFIIGIIIYSVTIMFFR